MASVKNILQTRSPNTAEQNLEQGKIWFYSPGTTYANLTQGFCWKSPGTGTAEIEVWGAGGPGAQGACCSFGIPGNSGAYSKKTVSVNASSYIYGAIGCSPVSTTASCFAGCGSSSGVCYMAVTQGCICAEGGFGGITYCLGTSAYPFDAFLTDGWCRTVQSADAHCGLICNTKSGCWVGNAYGGDINKSSVFSCIQISGCQPTCQCLFTYINPIPAGMIGTAGVRVAYAVDSDGGQNSMWTGAAQRSFFAALSAASPSPKIATHLTNSQCWGSGVSCGCYTNAQGSTPIMPIGAGGLPATPCAGVCDAGSRGGWGAVRIRFY